MYENGYVDGLMMSGNLGVVQVLFFIIIAAVFIYPIGLILKRLGYSPFWAVLAFVPALNLIGLWIVALGLGGSELRPSKTVDRTGGA